MPDTLPETLNALADALTVIADDINVYIQTAAGQTDPNRQALSAAAIAMAVASDDLADDALCQALRTSAQAVAVITRSTCTLNQAIATRQQIAHVLGVVQTLAGLATAIATANPAGIISAGADLDGALGAGA